MSIFDKFIESAGEDTQRSPFAPRLLAPPGEILPIAADLDAPQQLQHRLGPLPNPRVLPRTMSTGHAKRPRVSGCHRDAPFNGIGPKTP
jgi:hypothetical protein